MAFPARLRELQREERAKVKPGSPFSAYQAAAKRAAARYHGKSVASSGSRGARRGNPSGKTWKWIAVGVAAVLLAPKILGGIQAKSGPQSP